MDIKDIKVGMKVKLLGKHRVYDKYDNIEDWFEDFPNNKTVQQIKEQGYGVVTYIDDHGEIWVDECENGTGWGFLPCDLEPYEEEPTQIKTPKEWLLTPSVICTARDRRTFITIAEDNSICLDDGKDWSRNLDGIYADDLKDVYHRTNFDIMKITYGKETVYERKEEEVKEMTIDEIEKIVGYKIKIINNK